MVPTIIIGQTESVPVEARNPEKGMVISDGMGISADSRVIKTKIPK